MTKTLIFLALFLSAPTWAFDYAAEREKLMAEYAAIKEEASSPAKKLNRFIEWYYRYTMFEFPEYATFVGYPEGHDRWTDNSPEADARRDREAEDFLEFIQGLASEQLTGADQLNYFLLSDRLGTSVAGQRFDGDYLPVNQMSGPQQRMAQLLTLMPARTVANYEDIVARLESADEVVDQTVAWMKAGLDRGVTPPKITLRDVPAQIENQLADDPLESPLLGSFKEMPESISADDQERLRAAAAAAYTEKLAPALRRMYDFMIGEYLPGARESIAQSDLPDGAAWYAHNVKRYTTTTLTPEEIHAIGLSEVKRIREAMEAIRQETGFEGDLQAFFEHLRTDPKFFFTEAEELLSTYRDIAKRADPELVKVFGHLPRTPYGVEPVPAYAEKSQTTAYYQRGSMEAGRPGIFFANTYALDTRPKWEMEALTLHEAVPGHHLQIAIQQELEDTAWFRRFGSYTAFVEGWGLYSESLGVEMGFYQDPYSKFGQLTYEMWRAIRLVVDTGMHALGWSRDQAIEFFKSNSGKSEHDITVEIDRYIVWPGQALAYKIGELKIKELRARASEKLGENFDLRAFHDEVLGQGSLPLTVLEQRIDAWIESQL
ncbi:MAG: DUF885 domain-containing protein [Xanthomonadales bacterium]|nr:DUF885 domain-containing protein [Xanthomonadales bacterium]